MNEINNIANKCKKCTNANCKKHCPIHNNIPLITKLIEEKEYDLAKEVLFQTNPFPYLTSILCDHDKQCFGNCLFKNVDFYNIEQNIGERYFDELITYPKQVEEDNVLIIGGGIAGLAIAHHLLKAGIKPTIYEKDNLGGIVLNAIPDFRFNKELFKKHIDAISKASNIVNKRFCKNDLDSLSKYTHIIVAIGCENETTSLNGEFVYKGIEVLKAYNEGKLNIQNKKVGVIGLGNTACDVARALKRLGNDVSIVYRRDIESSPASKKELNDLMNEDIKILSKFSPVSFESNILTVKLNELLEVAGTKRKQIVETDKVEKFNFDIIVEALGSKVDQNFIDMIFSAFDKKLYEEYLLLKQDKNRRSETLYQDKKSISVIGDAYYGAWNIAEAINSANEVVNKIYPRFLFGGSFDPITLAHTQIIDYLSSIGRVLVVPNGNKYNLKNLTSFDKRVNMLEIEFNKLDYKHRILISDYEKSSAYKGSIETLRYFNHPIMVIGDDCLLKLDTWINPETLIKENKFLVITRHQNVDDLIKYIKNNELLSKYENNFKVVNILDDKTRMISSSAFKLNTNVDFVSKEILDFIKENKLYEV